MLWSLRLHYLWLSFYWAAVTTWHGWRDAAAGLPTEQQRGYLDRLAAHRATIVPAHHGDVVRRERADLELKAALERQLPQEAAAEQRVAAELEVLREPFRHDPYADSGEDLPPYLRLRRNTAAERHATAAKRAELDRLRARREATEVRIERLTETIAQRRARLQARLDEYLAWVDHLTGVYTTANARARARRIRIENRRAAR